MFRIILGMFFITTLMFAKQSEYEPIYQLGNKMAEKISARLAKSLNMDSKSTTFKTQTIKDIVTQGNNSWPILEVTTQVKNKFDSKTINYILYFENYQQEFIVTTLTRIKVNNQLNNILSHKNKSMYIYENNDVSKVKYNNGQLVYVSNSSDNEIITVTDFIIDYNSLINSNICIKGNIFAIGNIVTLSDIDNPMSQISLSINNLQREVKKEIISMCNGINTCIKIVCGIAKNIEFSQGIEVNEIE